MKVVIFCGGLATRFNNNKPKLNTLKERINKEDTSVIKTIKSFHY